MDKEPMKPQGELVFQIVAMPGDGNANKGVFGGWILSQLDLAGGIFARGKVKSRVTTLAIDALRFHHPMPLGDIACCYGSVTHVGHTSITVKIELWATHMHFWGPPVEGEPLELICEGLFTFVALDEDLRPKKISD